MHWKNIVINLLIAFSPVALTISAVLGVRISRQDSANRRNRFSLVAVLFLLAAAGLWPAVWMYRPPLPLQTDPNYLQAVNRAHLYVQTFRWFGIALCILALASSFFGRLRIVVPVLMASAGTVLFWWVSTTWP